MELCQTVAPRPVLVRIGISMPNANEFLATLCALLVVLDSQHLRRLASCQPRASLMANWVFAVWE